MKVVLNNSFGGFHYPEKFCQFYNVNKYDWMNDDNYHENKMLIDWVENNQNDSEGLEVVEIPDEATDWQIHDYDGLEDVIYVINGKIMWI